jgi:hypothetical protein
LSDKELDYLDSMFDQTNRFSKQNPLYQKNKEIYPFFTGKILTRADESKLLSCLLEKVLTSVRDDADIKRNVIIKGYTRLVHVDIKEKRMLLTHENIYESYPGRGGHFNGPDNIDREGARSEWQAILDGTHKSSDTTHKSIKVNTKPLK